MLSHEKVDLGHMLCHGFLAMGVDCLNAAPCICLDQHVHFVNNPQPEQEWRVSAGQCELLRPPALQDNASEHGLTKWHNGMRAYLAANEDARCIISPG